MAGINESVNEEYNKLETTVDAVSGIDPKFDKKLEIKENSSRKMEEKFDELIKIANDKILEKNSDSGNEYPLLDAELIKNFDPAEQWVDIQYDAENEIWIVGVKASDNLSLDDYTYLHNGGNYLEIGFFKNEEKLQRFYTFMRGKEEEIYNNKVTEQLDQFASQIHSELISRNINAELDIVKDEVHDNEFSQEKREDIRGDGKNIRKAEDYAESENETTERLLIDKLDHAAELAETATLEAIEAEINAAENRLDILYRDFQAINESIESSTQIPEQIDAELTVLKAKLIFSLVDLKAILKQVELNPNWKRSTERFDYEFDDIIDSLFTGREQKYADRVRAALDVIDSPTVKDRQLAKAFRKLDKYNPLLLGEAVLRLSTNERRVKSERIPPFSPSPERGNIDPIEGFTSGSSPEGYISVEVTDEGVITREDLLRMPIQQLIDIENKYADDDMTLEVQTYRRTLGKRLVSLMAQAPERAEGTVIDSMSGRLIEQLGNGDINAGHEKFWDLLSVAYMDSAFQKSMNYRITRNMQLLRASKMEEYRNTNRTYLVDYFELVDNANEDAILVESFLHQLSIATNIDGMRLRWIMDGYRNPDGKIDLSLPARAIRERYAGDSDLGKANAAEIAWSGGLGGGTRFLATKAIEAGWMSPETAVKAVRAVDTVAKLAETGFLIAGLWHGAKAVWSGLGVLRYMGNEEKRKKARGNTKKSFWNGLAWGVGARQGMKFIQDPRNYWENSKVDDFAYSIASTLGIDIRSEDRKKEDLKNSDEILSLTPSMVLVEETLGQRGIAELIDTGILVQQGEHGISIDMDAYLQAFPQIEDTYQEVGGRVVVKALIKRVEESLTGDYGLDRQTLQSLKDNAGPSIDVLKARSSVKSSLDQYKTVLGGLFPADLLDKAMDMEADERAELQERLAFVAQQKLKLTDKTIMKKFINQHNDALRSANPEKEDSELALLDSRDFIQAITAKLGAKDTAGVSGLSALEKKLQVVLAGTDQDITDYFKAVNVVFNNVLDLDSDATKQSPGESPLYIPTGQFLNYIHDTDITTIAGERGSFGTNGSKDLDARNSTIDEYNPLGSGNTWESIFARL